MERGEGKARYVKRMMLSVQPLRFSLCNSTINLENVLSSITGKLHSTGCGPRFHNMGQIKQTVISICLGPNSVCFAFSSIREQSCTHFNVYLATAYARYITRSEKL